MPSRSRSPRTSSLEEQKREAEAENARRKERQQRAKDAEENEKNALALHLAEVDQRLLVNQLRKEAERQKRQADAWDPTPKVRPMYGDADIRRSTAVPGPGAHSPRLAAVEQSFGTTFAASQFRVGQEFDRGAGSPDRWKLKGAADQPGPASYTLQSPRGGDHNKPGRSFGLPPELQASWQGETPVPDAHDMNRMVRHLRDLPAPDAYSPRNSKQGPEPNKAFRMQVRSEPHCLYPSAPPPLQLCTSPPQRLLSISPWLITSLTSSRTQPSKTLTPLEVEMKEAGAKPGPGQYEPSLPAGRSTMIGGSGELTSEIDRIMKQSAYVRTRGFDPSATSG